MACIRCGRIENIEIHHIKERCHGGDDEPENKEERCSACHDYEHARRGILGALEYEKNRGQKDRIKVYDHRLELLEKLNSPELIRERGTYISYWTDTSTRRLPRRIHTPEETQVESMVQLALSEEMGNPSV